MFFESLKSTKLCAKLVNDKEFCSLATNELRISYVLKNIKTWNEFREEISNIVDNYCKISAKSLYSSQLLREEGDNHLVLTDYYSSIRCYSYAILRTPFSTSHSECNELKKCYISRSVTFLQLGDYINAYFDTERALLFDQTLELLLQKALCLRYLKRFKEGKQLIEEVIASKDCFQLKEESNLMNKFHEMKKLFEREIFTYDCIEEYSECKGMQTIIGKEVFSNEDIGVDGTQTHPQTIVNFDNDLWIDPNIEIKTTEEKGRHYVTKDMIPKDWIIIAEKSKNAMLSIEAILWVCSNCHKNIGYQFWPCISCNEVVFCDQKCHDRGMADFHRFECQISGLLLRHPFRETYRAVTRIGTGMGLHEMSELDRNEENFISKLDKCLQEIHGTDIESVFRGIKEKQINYFNGLLSLIDHNQEYSPPENANHILMAIETAFLMDNKNVIQITEEKTFVSFVAILVQIYRKTIINSFGWIENSSRIGCCVSFFGSFFNHSCCPNTSWSFVEGKQIFKTLENIKAGEELTISYGPNYKTSLSERQTNLRINYHFVCNCELCLIQAETYPSLKCLQCEGPVVVVINNMRNNSNACLMCGSNYENIEEVLNRVSSLRLNFDFFLKKVEVLSQNETKTEFKSDIQEVYDSEIESEVKIKSDPKNCFEIKIESKVWTKNRSEIDLCLKRAEESLKAIIGLHYHKCDEVFELMMKLSKVYIKCSNISKTFKHFSTIVSSVDWSKSDRCVKHWKDLLLITTVYYNHYIWSSKHQNQLQKNDWKQCFESFSALKQCYITIKSDPEIIKTMSINGQPLGSIEKIKNIIREKKDNFLSLKHIYKSLLIS